MAKPDEYGPRIEEVLREAMTNAEAVSVADIVEKVGCGDGRVRQWIDRHPHMVEQAGVNAVNAKTYQLRNIPLDPPPLIGATRKTPGATRPRVNGTSSSK